MTTLPTSDRAARLKKPKEKYCQRLIKLYDNIEFAGISVAGQETDKSAILSEIFVMPDVVEEVSRLDRPSMQEELPSKLSQSNDEQERELLRQQRELVFSENRSGKKCSARDLFSQTQSKKIVLLGAPGSGKTTLSIYFALILARNSPQSLGLSPDKDWLPILIRIRDWIRYPGKSIIDYLQQFVINTMSVSELPPGFFQHWLENGRALILLDGLDEVPEESRRYSVVEQITDFLAQYRQNTVIITSRPAGYRRDFFRTQEFPHYQLQPFDDRQIEQFINYWYDSRIPDPVEAARRKESLRQALTSNERVKLLARNPLLLNIIVLIHRYQARLPKERYKLYNSAIDTLLTAWDTNKEISGYKELHYLDLDDLRRLMEILAYWIHQQGSRGDKEGGTLIEREALIAKLTQEIELFKQIETCEAKDEANRFVNYIRDRTGLLNEQGRDVYAFVHKTFQEYLCAQEIDYQARDEGFEVILEHIDQYLHAPHWREVLLLLIAQQTPKKAAKAIRAILNYGSEYEQWLHRDLLFAGSCLVENPKNLRVADNKLPQEILQRLVELEASSENLVGGRVRQQVFQTLCSLYETDFEAQALQLLKSKGDRIDEQRLRKYQVALGEKEAVIANLLGRLEDEHSGVRSSAARVLGKLGSTSEPVVAALLGRLEDEDSGVRSSAAEALDKLGSASEPVVAALLGRLEDKDSSVRLYAAVALGKLGSTSEPVVAALLGRLEDEYYRVRYSAAEALGELGSASEPVVAALLGRLEDEDYWVLSFAAVALGKLGSASEPVIAALLGRLEDEDYWVRSSAARVLGKLGSASEPVVAALLGRLEDESSSVRSSAADALGKLGSASKQVVDALLGRLEDESSSVRSSAAEALGNLGKQSSEVLPAVVKWLQQHQDAKYIGSGIDVLWDLVAAE